MNKKIKDTIEDYEKMQIGVDEPFLFCCSQCGKCCINRDDILLTPKDLFNIARELKISIKDTLDKYCEFFIGDSSLIPIVRLKPYGEYKCCPLLKDNKCSVHNSKPVVCSMYPIGRYIKLSSHDISTEIEDYKIEYILPDADCLDNFELHTVREWLNKFNIHLNDEFFIRWSIIVFKLSIYMNKIKENCQKATLNITWDLLFTLLYLNYDIEKDFLPQYIENTDDLMNILKMLPVDCLESDNQSI